MSSVGCSVLTGSCVQAQIAASAVLLANVILGRSAWTPTLQHYSGYNPCDLIECCKLMHKVHQAQHRPEAATPATRDKYAQPKYYCVSAIQSSMDVLPNYLFRSADRDSEQKYF